MTAKTRRFASCLLTWACLALLPASSAWAEGESEHPAFNGGFYQRWTSLLGASREAGPQGNRETVLWCRHVGSFADRDTSYRIKLKVQTRGYLLSPALERKWGITGSDLGDSLQKHPEVSGICPALPELQSAAWVPKFVPHEQLVKLGFPAEVDPRETTREEVIDLEIQARKLEDSQGLCDDAGKRISAWFAGRSEPHRQFCRALAAREFDRGLRKCLAVADRGLNRSHDRGFNPAKTEAVVWRKSDPTPSYCESLLRLGGTGFEMMFEDAYACDTPFQALLLLEASRFEEVLRGVFGTTATRVSPLIRRINKSCEVR
jgi:hypothetical protein